MNKMPRTSTQRFKSESGIAIGPILFIIAILAILAAAIAAGSGSFTAGTTTESSKTRAAALIQIGEIIKTGVDRLIMEQAMTADVTPASNVIVTNSTVTTTANGIYAPVGGGVTPPSSAMAAFPAKDIWYYPLVHFPQVGTSKGSLVAVIRVDAATCDQINNSANGISITTVPGASTTLTVPDAHASGTGDFGNWLLDGNNGNAFTLADASSTWPTTGLLAGKIIGCVNNTNATMLAAVNTADGDTAATYYFFEFLAVQ